MTVFLNETLLKQERMLANKRFLQDSVGVTMVKGRKLVPAYI